VRRHSVGYSLPGSEEGDRELLHSKPPVFWGQGDFDEVIPQDDICRTAIWLRQHSTLTERIYEMGRNVCPAELDDVAGFVVEQIGD
jgi:phospholipase/carboxylesterase